MARSAILHVGSAFHFIGCFVDDKAVSGDDCPDVVFFLFTSNAEDLVLDLNRAEILR